MTTPDIGVIYVLANRDRSLSKVGLTRLGTPQGRAIGHTRAHGIEWCTYWSAPTRDVAKVRRPGGRLGRLVWAKDGACRKTLQF